MNDSPHSLKFGHFYVPFPVSLFRLWALITTEIRSCRRLTRTWVFIAIACVVTLQQWVVLTDLYNQHSLTSPVYGLVGPRFLISEMGGTMLLWFSIGAIFLAFDMQFRDDRDRIGEVLNIKPASDFVLILGRLLGVVLLLAIPACGVVLVMLGCGVIAETFNVPLGTPMEPVSVFAFLVWDIVPNLVLWSSLTVLLTRLLRFRFLVVLATLILLGSVHLLSIALPFSVSSVFSMHTGVNTYPSELAPTFANLNILVNRGLMIAIAVGCLALTALYQSRNQSGKTYVGLLSSGIGLMLGVFGVIGGLLIGNSHLNDRTVRMWVLTHKQNQLHSSTNIQEVSGTIEIQPGRSVSLNLTLAMEPSKDLSSDGWLFSLNPGYRINNVTVNSVPTNDYKFEHGLLHIPRDDSVASSKVSIVAKGKPDERFAYLDSSIDWRSLHAIGAKRLFYLGRKSYIFHPKFVALMPGVSWIPTSGSAYGVDELELRPRDFFSLDVKVTVPKGWMIAGPGSRDVLDGSRKSTYRLATQNPITGFALISSKFTQRLIEIDGVEFELLVNKKHTENLNAFEESTPRITEWIKQRCSLIHDSGLRYPYSRLSLVEVPTSLRTYGGGWRMDSVYSTPGVQMIRESGFPVAPFGTFFRHLAEFLEKRNVDIQKVMLNDVITYFANDLHGGDPLVGIPKNFVDYQTAPTGNGATALRYLTNEFARRLTTKALGYFSVYTALSRGTGVETFHTSTTFNTFDLEEGRRYRINDWRREYALRPSAWEVLEHTPLSSIDYPSDPQNNFHALLLKGERVTDAVIDTYGEELVAEFLSLLVNRYRGRSYTDEDFQRAALDAGIDIHATVGDWLNERGMAGFVVKDLKSTRLSVNRGEAVYQTTFRLENNEPVPGVVKISYQAPSEKDRWWSRPIPLEPLHLDGKSAILVAFQSSNPPTTVWLEPRLSLNRDPIRLDLQESDYKTSLNSPILPYSSRVDWKPEEKFGIIVDDLDEGFSIEFSSLESNKSLVPKWLEHAAAVPSQDFDKGLPVQENSVNMLENRANPLFNIVSTTLVGERLSLWYRDNEPTSYGKYRRTYAGKRGGLDQSKAIFSTTIPTSGTWKLDYHVPVAMRTEIQSEWMRSPNQSSGSYTHVSVGIHTFHVLNDETQTEIEFDGGSALPGWNELGIYDLNDSKVDVVLIEVTRGYGIADAIRWTPL